MICVDVPALDRPCQHCRDGREPVVGFALTGSSRDLFAPIQELPTDARIVKRGDRHVAEFGFGLRQHAPIFSLVLAAKRRFELDGQRKQAHESVERTGEPIADQLSGEGGGDHEARHTSQDDGTNWIRKRGGLE